MVPLAVSAHFGPEPVVASVRLVGADRPLFAEAARRVGERGLGFVIKTSGETVLDLRPHSSDTDQEAALRILLLASNHPDLLADELVRAAANLPRGDDASVSLPELLTVTGSREVAVFAEDASRAHFALTAAHALDSLAPDAVPVLFELVDLRKLAPGVGARSHGSPLTPGRVGLGLFLFLLYLAR